MDASSSNNFDDFLDEKFDQIFDQQFDNLFTWSLGLKIVKKHQDQKRNELTLKDNENKGTYSYGTTILVKMQHIILKCFDAVLE